MAKTNKSYIKRLKVTTAGKILSKKPGGNHFNAKERRVNQLKRRRWQSFGIKNKTKARFLGK